jgi:hypothetical protein
MEDHPAQYSREHEVGTCIDNADTNCTVGQRESAREEPPHDCIKE